MTIPPDFFQSTQEGQLRQDIFRLYELIQNSYNKSLSVQDFVSTSGVPFGFVEGSVSGGGATYTTQQAFYVRDADLVSFWFTFTWTAHSGSGNIIILLPFTTTLYDGFFIGQVETRNITWPVGTTQVQLSAAGNANVATVFATGSGSAGSGVTLPASGTVNGFIRYIATPLEV